MFPPFLWPYFPTSSHRKNYNLNQNHHFHIVIFSNSHRKNYQVIEVYFYISKIYPSRMYIFTTFIYTWEVSLSRSQNHIHQYRFMRTPSQQAGKAHSLTHNLNSRPTEHHGDSFMGSAGISQVDISCWWTFGRHPEDESIQSVWQDESFSSLVSWGQCSIKLCKARSAHQRQTMKLQRAHLLSAYSLIKPIKSYTCLGKILIALRSVWERSKGIQFQWVFAMTKTARAVFQILTSQPDKYNISIDRLAQLSGVSRQGVKRAIALLEENGVIVVTRTVINGRYTENMYRIIDRNAPKWATSEIKPSILPSYSR